ncbi:MAG: hypothetical protein WB421_11055 [Terriglobales bacterium]
MAIKKNATDAATKMTSLIFISSALKPLLDPHLNGKTAAAIGSPIAGPGMIEGGLVAGLICER